MVLTLTIPEPGEKKRIKDIILDILSFDWPLTLSQIHNKIKKNYNHPGTCQATYKAITELVQEEVIVKQNKIYSINLSWLEKLRVFTEHITNNYKNKEKLPLIEGVLKTKTENNVTVLTFNSILEMDKTWVSIKKEYYKSLEKKNDITFWEGNHCWWLLVYPEFEYSEMELIKEKKVRDFAIIHSNTPLDKESKGFYDRSGVKFKFEKGAVESDITVFGDTIMQVYIPKELREKMDELYNKSKTSSEMDVHALLKDILTKKVKINLILTRNKEIAEQLKRKAISDFNQKV